MLSSADRSVVKDNRAFHFTSWVWRASLSFLNREKSALSIQLTSISNHKPRWREQIGSFSNVKRIGAYTEGVCCVRASPVFVICNNLIAFPPSGRQRGCSPSVRVSDALQTSHASCFHCTSLLPSGFTPPTVLNATVKGKDIAYVCVPERVIWQHIKTWHPSKMIIQIHVCWFTTS